MAHLEARGYLILARNYRCAIGELDIVAMDGSCLVFVEVRSRADDRHGTALASVTPAKQRQVARVAEAYLARERPHATSVRFDVVGVTGGELRGELTHVVDAFRSC